MGEALRLGTSNRRLDPAAIQQGVEKKCPYRPGLTVRILPGATYNPRFRKALQNQAFDLSSREADREEIGREVLSRYHDPQFVVDALVADIDGLYNGKGNAVKYTPERGLQIFADDANADVLQWVVNEAMDYGQFYTEVVEEEAGNS